VHTLGTEATAAYEGARAKVATFIGATSPDEVVFTKNSTEAINLVAYSFLNASLGKGGDPRFRLGPGDEIVISEMEHHSNIVPWQMVCDEKAASLRVIPINDAGELRLDDYERMLSDRTRLVAVTHVSNALGTVNPVADVIRLAHQRGARVLLDGAQAVAHMPVDVQALDCDFYVFSGHKVLGPTGVGVLYAKSDLLAAMPPYQGGGDMIRSVAFERTLYNVPPHKFEAGTPNIAGVVGLAAALDYLTAIGFDRVAAHEHDLLVRGTEALSQIPGLRLTGTARDKAGILAFVLDEVHPHDVGTILDQEGVAIRAGHHCCQPLMARLGVPATARASFAFYNTRDEIDVLARALHKARELFT
jgi:cysteine desulfurase/selenocysteine lyase